MSGASSAATDGLRDPADWRHGCSASATYPPPVWRDKRLNQNQRDSLDRVSSRLNLTERASSHFGRRGRARTLHLSCAWGPTVPCSGTFFRLPGSYGCSAEPLGASANPGSVKTRFGMQETLLVVVFRGPGGAGKTPIRGVSFLYQVCIRPTCDSSAGRNQSTGNRRRSSTLFFTL